MIELLRLNGEKILLNPDQILWIESTPDTVITLNGGAKVTVKNTKAEVSKLFTDYKKNISAPREV